MEKNSPKYNQAYDWLRNYSQKYTPYKWLYKIGFKNIEQEKITYFSSRYGLSFILILSALFISYIFKFYPDKSPFYMIYLIFVVLSAWHGGFKTGIFTAGAISTGLYFLTKSIWQYGLGAGLIPQLTIFISSAIIISFFVDLARKTNEIKKLKRQEKVYAQKFLDLHSAYTKAGDEIKARDEFLSLLSHELKTPLTTMLLKLHSMLNSVRSVSLANFSVPELMRVLNNAEEQIRWLTAMIGDLQNISLITTGRMRLNIEDVDLVAMTKQVTQNFSELLKRGKYKIKIEANAPVVGRWDKTRIEQVVTNLVSNAIKYGRSKPINIKIQNSGGMGKFIIQDQGIGILPKEQKVIFGLFHRTERSNEYKKGLGVGLYITSQIVKIHGGKIRVTSSPGKGSEFTIELPIKRKS